MIIPPQYLTEKQIAIREAQESRRLAFEERRRQEEEKNKIVILPPKELTERQLDWIRQNSQPKVRKIVRVMAKFSRWAKRGPMSRKDWVNFFKWADENAEAKQKPKPHCVFEEVKKKKSRGEYAPSAKEVEAHLKKLSTPKLPREKYEYPPPVKYPYSPQIEWDKPPKRDKGRPFKPPKVPKEFQHIELEIDFWSQLRFPIRSSALKYNPSFNIVEIAKPRVPAIEPHCPIPEKPVEYVAPRKRMSKAQWEFHKRRLICLANPVNRPIIFIISKKFMTKEQWEEHQKRLEVLATQPERPSFLPQYGPTALPITKERIEANIKHLHDLAKPVQRPIALIAPPKRWKKNQWANHKKRLAEVLAKAPARRVVIIKNKKVLKRKRPEEPKETEAAK